ncbi:hypothetical protein Trco_002500 [Trichoderma cornu-damae]|uniref:Fe2OG dioxygenase domain-containing protein n=1 Tax=Trichoderma cornu-damae TaxID=654480 RepID=A0A9P8TXW0_9HYPO|nr:hypothetical protein Trco_002500 [Trichoderma cornu-damae]
MSTQAQYDEVAVESLPLGVPTAKLQTIDLERLIEQNEDEINRLLRASVLEGFFYLDLRGISQKTGILDHVNDIFTLETELFGLDTSEKLQYDIDKTAGKFGKMKLSGYKPIGRNFGGIGGKSDGFESYSIPKDGILGLEGAGDFARPPPVDAHKETLEKFMTFVQHASQAIYRGLSSALAVEPSEAFENFHRPSASSPDLLRLLKYHPQPVTERGAPQTPHTDLGSLTFLFTRQNGLQVLPRGAQDWAYVECKPGHAIINLGDGMSLMSNGLLQSCLHRVAPLPSEAFKTRYSFAYLQRAEDHTIMRGLKSPVIPQNDPQVASPTSAEWLAKKFGMLRGATHTKEDSWVLTGVKPQLIATQ